MDPDEIPDLSGRNDGDDEPAFEPEMNEYGDPEGTEYDDDGNIFESAPVETEPEPIAADKPSRTPPAINSAGMTPDQESEIDELFLTNPRLAYTKMRTYERQTERQQQAASDYQTETITEQAPELMKQYGRLIREGIEAVNRETPGSLDAVNVGGANAFLSAMRANKGDIVKTVTEMYEALQTPASRPKAVLPASQRTPGKGASGDGRGAVSPVAVRGMSTRVKMLVDNFGMSRAEAERAADA